MINTPAALIPNPTNKIKRRMHRTAKVKSRMLHPSTRTRKSRTHPTHWRTPLHLTPNTTGPRRRPKARHRRTLCTRASVNLPLTRGPCMRIRQFLLCIRRPIIVHLRTRVAHGDSGCGPPSAASAQTEVE